MTHKFLAADRICGPANGRYSTVNILQASNEYSINCKNHDGTFLLWRQNTVRH